MPLMFLKNMYSPNLLKKIVIQILKKDNKYFATVKHVCFKNLKFVLKNSLKKIKKHVLFSFGQNSTLSFRNNYNTLRPLKSEASGIYLYTYV